MGRLVFSIFTTLLEEVFIVALGLIGLPALGVHVPLPVLYALMVGWAASSVVTYRLGTRALEKKPTPGLPALDGCDGLAVTPLAVEGMVRVKGELWSARSVNGIIREGEAVEVMERQDMKLLVRRCQGKKESEANGRLVPDGPFRVDEGDDQ
ncbi:MAG: NfeD family protein [Chloroflexi bacterium]|nr:NfeD family protein [Chloroflexota bacterium]